VLRARLRGATIGERPKLMEFYLKTEMDTLPPPSVQTLENSLRSGLLLVVEDTADSSVLATGGYFDYIKSIDNHQIFELPGTRVTGSIGRLSPIPLQQILLAIRLFQIVSTEGRDNAVSVISSARHPRSIANLQALRIAEMANMPKWLEYDTCSWTRMSERASWRHFIATEETMHRAIVILDEVAFSSGVFECASERKRQDNVIERLDVSIQYDLLLCRIFPAAQAARDNNQLKRSFAPLPDRWPV